jgi:hypothetical protein
MSTVTQGRGKSYVKDIVLKALMKEFISEW